MIEHMVTMRLKPEYGEAEVTELAQRLERLAELVPSVRSLRVLRDAGLRDGNGQVALIAEFTAVPDFHAYLSHPAHLQVVEECVMPWTEQRLGLQAEH